MASEGKDDRISAYSGHSGFALSHAGVVWFWAVGFRDAANICAIQITRNDKTEWMNFCLRRSSRLDLSVQQSIWFCVESRCWCVVLASWFRDAANICAIHGNTK